jgi:ABC-type lipoprotein release transport system permease subunit
MISSNTLQEFLTHPDFEWEVVEPKHQTVWDIITDHDPGTVHIGHEVARRQNIMQGEEIDIFDTKFKVVNCLANSGSIDDIRIYGHLHDVQQLLNLPGHINEIKALECLCLLESGQTETDAYTLVQRQLTKILPDAQVILLQGIANIREKQRAVMEGYLELLMLFIIIACGVWIGVLAMLNVKERVYEIGILRAIGHGGDKIAGLFVGKSIIVGLIGAIPGCLIGTVLALLLGPDIFKITARAIQADYALMLWAIGIAPVFTTISTFIPMLIAIGQDPALTLRNE